MKEILTGIADLIFPPRCITCEELLEQHGPLPFCPRCMAGIRFIGSPSAPGAEPLFPPRKGKTTFAGSVSSRKDPMRSHDRSDDMRKRC